MSRKRKGDLVHGWVVVDKPQGVTSTQAVSTVRHVFNAQKAGHAGTLDPMATGVLAVALGEATKTVPFAMEAEKTYRFTACWGEARDSDDSQRKKKIQQRSPRQTHRLMNQEVSKRRKL